MLRRHMRWWQGRCCVVHTGAGVEPAHGMPKFTCNKPAKCDAITSSRPREVEHTDKPMVAISLPPTLDAPSNGLAVNLKETGEKRDEAWAVIVIRDERHEQRLER